MQNGVKNYFFFSYIFGLLIIFGVFVAGQVFINLKLKEIANTPELINASGRQRMLSQKLTKAAILSVRYKDQSEK